MMYCMLAATLGLLVLHLMYFNVMLFLQTDRTRADRASDQKQFEGDHDAERPRECHLQRGESVLQMLDSMTLQTDERGNLGPEGKVRKMTPSCSVLVNSI